MLVYLDPDPVNIRNMSRSLGVCLTRATGVGEHLRVRGDDLLTLHDQSDGLHAVVGEGGVASKLGLALDTVLETVQDVGAVLGDDFAHGLEGQLHNVLVRVQGGEVEPIISDHLSKFQLGNTFEHLHPTGAEIVSISLRHGYQSLDSVKVLCLHLRDIRV